MSFALFATALLSSGTIVPTASLPVRDEDPCAVFDRKAVPDDGIDRTWTTRIQTEMADIGQPEGTRDDPGSGVSPDNRLIAYIMRRANPDANAYCQRLMVAPVDGSGPAREVGRGGDFIRDDFAMRNFTSILAGWPRPNPPRWSPDGSRIGFLRREHGSTQVWLADPEGVVPPRQLSRLPDDVDSFAWSDDGSGVIVVTRPGIRAEANAIAEEGLRGFLFDDRFSPQFADYPIPTSEAEPHYIWISANGDEQRSATTEEIARIVATRPDDVPQTARTYLRGSNGYAAWSEPRYPERILSPYRLVRSAPGGQRTVCESADCEGVRGIFFAGSDGTLISLHSGGWARAQSLLLRWDPDRPEPRRLLVTDDFLVGCMMAAHELLCEREGSIQPRRLVGIDTESGKERVILDPNPHLSRLRFGRPQRLRFTLPNGVDNFADLVLPPDHREGQRHPLVIVQYRSRGFLRGGVGDEVPVQPLVARGFAVLSIDRPGFPPEAYLATNEAEIRTLSADPWADRRQSQAAIETAVRLAIGTGTVDPARMGISGFSDGSSAVQFALINSDLFRVASMGSCCEDRNAFALAAGPHFTDYLRKMGYPYFDRDADAFWQPMSFIQNVDRIDVPILIQMPDSEYEGALDVVAAFAQHGKPLELYVFPDESHFKWQPAHRLAMYDRVVEWFEFWLMGKVNCDGSRLAQYRRWEAMPGAPTTHAAACPKQASGSP